MINGFWVCSDRDATGYAIVGNHFVTPSREAMGYSRQDPLSAYLIWQSRSDKLSLVLALDNELVDCAAPMVDVTSNDKANKELSIFIRNLWCLLLVFVPAILITLWWAGYSL